MKPPKTQSMGGEYVTIDEFLRQSIQKNQQEAEKFMLEQKQKRIAELLAKSGLGKRFQKRTFANTTTTPRNRHAVAAAREFAEQFPNVQQGLLFMGTAGVGKTHLAAAIANELIGELYTVIFGNATDIITLIKSSYDNQVELSEAQILKTITEEVDFLVIDDLGKEHATENTKMLLYQIVNRLYENEKPIVVTTNLTSDALASKYGERGKAIVSRLTEMCQPIVLEDDDWRIRRPDR